MSSLCRPVVSADANLERIEPRLLQGRIHRVAQNYEERQTQIDSGVTLTCESRIINKSNEAIASRS